VKINFHFHKRLVRFGKQIRINLEAVKSATGSRLIETAIRKRTRPSKSERNQNRRPLKPREMRSGQSLSYRATSRHTQGGLL
jgi:hypothetical protein